MYGYTSKDIAYHHDIDLLKGVAIIAVLLYHAGWCKSGYLGVDVFFVLSGFLIVPKVIDQIADGSFSYWRFLEKRLFRLLPLVLLVNFLVLLMGYWVMLPGDYRYLSEEAIAASFFVDNILEAIVTQNYWAAIYHKILMHTWFLGVLFQFYVVFPLLMMLIRRKMQKALILLTLLSLLLYLLPIDSIGNKYYLLPYRFFELSAGGLVAIRPFRRPNSMCYASLLCLLLMIFFGAFTIGERAMPYNLEGGTNTIRESFLPREIILLLTVAFTVLFLFFKSKTSRISAFARRSRLLSPLGRMSLSIFLWHQPLIAFYRYLYADDLSVAVLFSVCIFTLILSFLSYRLVEQKIRISLMSRLFLMIAFTAVVLFASKIYLQGGVVRDVPELDIKKGMADPDVFERYTDRIYQYDCNFPKESDQQKILVIGNSFARDFANILLESPDSARLQISYHPGFGGCPMSRIRQCDRIYYFGWKHQVPDSVWSNVKKGTEIWGIGTKNHGKSNGIFYKNRNHSDYFSQRVAIHEDFHKVNRLLHDEWGSHYVDLMSLTQLHDGTFPVFTPNHHFITYDGKHLTPAGTIYYMEQMYKHK